MAEYKTAEQYVVDKLETIEMELDNAKVEHSMEVGNLMLRLNSAEAQLADAHQILNMLRDFIGISAHSYWGTVVDFEQIYGTEHPELVDLLMEYYDMRPEEDE